MRIAMTSLAEKGPMPPRHLKWPQSNPGPLIHPTPLNPPQDLHTNHMVSTEPKARRIMPVLTLVPRMEHLYDTEGRTRVGSKGA